MRRWVYDGDEDFCGIRGFFEEVEGYRYKLHVRVFLSRYRSQVPCPACHGARLKPEALAVTVAGRSIAELGAQTSTTSTRCSRRSRSPRGRPRSARDVLSQLAAKLSFLLRVGLGYLTVDAPDAHALGRRGAAHHLANQLGAQLVGTLYVLDEPSIGLHARDTARLAELCRELAPRGNTVVVVEHDRAFIEAADYLLELGPGSGERGGEIVLRGPQDEFRKDTRSLTARYLSRPRSIPLPARAPATGPARPRAAGAREHNLKNVTVRDPAATRSPA